MSPEDTLANSNTTRDGTLRLAMHLRNKWLVEIGELSSFSKADVDALKAVLTKTEGQFTPKFARKEVKEPRQCLFIGTTNKDTYLRDDTGGRRFWPVKAKRIDLEALDQNRDQLFAEATHRYLAGEKWWPASTSNRSRTRDMNPTLGSL